MTPDIDESKNGTPRPADAIATLGNETPIEVLRTLGEAREPLTFSELFDAVDIRDNSQCNYHLE